MERRVQRSLTRVWSRSVRTQDSGAGSSHLQAAGVDIASCLQGALPGVWEPEVWRLRPSRSSGRVAPGRRRCAWDRQPGRRAPPPSGFRLPGPSRKPRGGCEPAAPRAGADLVLPRALGPRWEAPAYRELAIWAVSVVSEALRGCPLVSWPLPTAGWHQSHRGQGGAVSPLAGRALSQGSWAYHVLSGPAQISPARPVRPVYLWDSEVAGPGG